MTILQGMMHGIGQRYFDNGTNYTGKFYHNQMHGRGQMEWPNGTRFIGEFANNRANGHGKMMFANGNKRKGVLKSGFWQGKADFTERDGTKWKEFWINGTFKPSLRLYKNVENNYTDVNVSKKTVVINDPLGQATV